MERPYRIAGIRRRHLARWDHELLVRIAPPGRSGGER